MSEWPFDIEAYSAPIPKSTGAASWVADLYDSYVTTAHDVPFFVSEAIAAHGRVLDLMAGTGRVSIPLVEAGADVTCVDISRHMLTRLTEKLAARTLSATTVRMDVSRLDLPDRDYALAILPFHSFAELITPEAQMEALARVAAHLRPGGKFICTLHNPILRRRAVDGRLCLLGTYPCLHSPDTLHLWAVQRRMGDSAVVEVAQFYRIYDPDGAFRWQRRLDVRFRLVGPRAFVRMAEAAGFSVAVLFGDYDRTPFQCTSSPSMIWVLRR